MAYPTPAAGNTWTFEYQSVHFCEAANGTGQSSWQADTDVGRLDESLMMLGLVWRFKKKNGLDYSEDYRVYEQKVANATGRTGGKKVLNMESGGSSAMGVYVPEGDWSV